MPPKIKIYRSNALVLETDGIEGETLRDRIKASDIFLDAPCGGRGRCGKCLVQLTPNGEAVKACQTHVEGDMDIYLPEVMKMKIAGAETQKSSIPYTGPLGIAVDIGTTTVVVHLTDIPTGARIATASGVNAQRAYGADVINRITYCAKNGHETLTRLIRDQLSELILETCKSSGASPVDIHYISIAGNTIMQHLAAGYSPVGMGVAPFAPVSLFGNELPAGDDLPVAKDAVIYFAPCVSSYVGGDITAGMLASDLENNNGPCLYIDIGTNGEIAMKVGDRYYCCATAAGPAFEGAEISKGMAAINGAISHIKLGENGLELFTIGDEPPTGLCGSGLLDTLAFLITEGIVDETGRMVDADAISSVFADRIGKLDGHNAFWLSREDDVYLTAGDVRKLQLAKAAISAGIQTIMHSAGIKTEDVSSFIIAGGFGSYLDKVSAATIGLFPKSFLPIASTMGNTAGEGAAIALCSKSARDTLQSMRERCQYVELSTSAYFSDQFMERIMFDN